MSKGYKSFFALMLALLIGVCVAILCDVFSAQEFVSTKRTVVVRALAGEYPLVPVSVTLSGIKIVGDLIPTLRDVSTGVLIPTQLLSRDEKLQLVWIERNLKRGQTKRYELVLVKPKALKEVGSAETKQVGNKEVGLAEAKRVNDEVEIFTNGELVTAYRYSDAPKPYFYPLIGPTGKPVTRHFPMKKDVPGERTDHPHHRSMWFTFGDVNGVDFWSEGARCGRIEHRSYEAIESGTVFARVVARCEWVGSDGKRLLEDTRELIVYCVEGMRLMDFNITLMAKDEDVKFGDTKEGMFGLRVACSMQVDGGGGHIVNSRGDENANAWGKRAEWCDYYGRVDGDVVGIAIFDHPQNFRHPTYWHVRTYGLFAANPFGVRSFSGSGDGSYVLRKGSSITFRYRIYIHKGDPKVADVALAYLAYAEPPQVSFE